MHLSNSEIFVALFSLHDFRCKGTAFFRIVQVFLKKNDQGLAILD